MCASKPRLVWRELWQQITERREPNQSVSEITFDTHLKTAL